MRTKNFHKALKHRAPRLFVLYPSQFAVLKQKVVQQKTLHFETRLQSQNYSFSLIITIQEKSLLVYNFSCKMCSLQSSVPLPMVNNTLTSFRLPLLSSPPRNCHSFRLRAVLSINEIPPNALRRKTDPQWRGGFSLGLDLGLSRTGLALTKGFTFRPLTVLELRGQKLELRLLEIAEDEEADEFIIGIPKSSDGKETPQSNKVRSVAGRIAVRAAERGWRVYLQDEHGTTEDASYRMINMGLGKGTREKKIDAYAAVMVLERYFATFGEGVELVIPKQLDLQDKLRKGPPQDVDFME